MCRVGQNRIYAPHMIVRLVITLPKMLYIHRMYMVLGNPRHVSHRQRDKLGRRKRCKRRGVGAAEG
jgi:hypothetical protein